jgi:DNA-binding MurR/RpiR family transcriptional regulator
MRGIAPRRQGGIEHPVSETTVLEVRTILDIIGARLPYLHPALRRIAEFILAQPGTAKGMTITELAAACGVAESTVTRFVKEVGLDRYASLRLAIAESRFASVEGAVESENVYGGILRGDSSQTIVAKIVQESASTLRATGARLDPLALERATDLLEGTGVIAFCAMGGSSIAAEDGVMRFTRAGRKCLLYRDQSQQLMSATVLGKGDVLIAISASGDSTPIIDAAARARASGAAAIAITSTEGSRLSESVDVTLFASAEDGSSAGLFGEGVTAKWGQLLVVDALYASYAVRHFDDTLRYLQETYTAAIRETRSR